VANSVNPHATGEYSLPVVCSGASMIIFRMMNNLRGYKDHKSYPVLKSINIGDIMLAWGNFNSDIKDIYSLSVGPANSAGMGPNDFKNLSYAALSKYFSGWQSIATGMSWENVATSGKYLHCGSFALTYASNLSAPKVVMENLSHIYPYRRKNSNAVIFPCAYITVDEPSNLFLDCAEEDTQFVADWNMLTNKTGTEEICQAQLGSASDFVIYYNQFIQLCGPYVPYSTVLDEDPVNLGCVSRVVTSSGGTIVGTCSSEVPDHILPLLSRNFLPYIDLSSGSSAQRSLLMMIYGEHDYEVELQNVTQLLSVGYLWQQSIHSSGGFGNNLGNPSVDVEDVGMKEAPKEEPRSRVEVVPDPLYEEVHYDYNDIPKGPRYNGQQQAVGNPNPNIHDNKPMRQEIRQTAVMRKGTTPANVLAYALMGGRKPRLNRG